MLWLNKALKIATSFAKIGNVYYDENGFIICRNSKHHCGVSTFDLHVQEVESSKQKKNEVIETLKIGRPWKGIILWVMKIFNLLYYYLLSASLQADLLANSQFRRKVSELSGWSFFFSISLPWFLMTCISGFCDKSFRNLHKIHMHKQNSYCETKIARIEQIE